MVTISWKVAVALLPKESLAVQVTFVEPCGKLLPEAGEQLIVGLGSRMSDTAGRG